MKKLEINSLFDGLTLSILILKSKGKIKGIVQIAHGMAEHKERYIPFMKFLNDNGYIAVIHDHRGHGKSIKSTSDYGYFYDDTGKAIVEDLHQITLYIKEKFPNLPIYLLGHSMGSMVARKYIKKYDRDISKLIVCGAPSRNDDVGIALKLTKVLLKIKGDKHRSKLLNNLTFGSYNRKFRIENSKNAWLCSDSNVVKDYDEDPQSGFIFTLNGFWNLFILLRDIYNEEDYLVRNPNMPILFIAGGQDPVIISKRDWEESQLFFKNIGYDNVKGILYRNMRHEILNEIDKIQVYEDILRFIET